MELIVVWLSHCGEKYWRMAVPIGGVAAPKVFATLFPETHLLGAMCRNLDGDNIVAEFHKAFNSGTMAKKISGSASLALISECECPTGQ